VERASFRIELALAALIVALAVCRSMVGPAGLSPRAAIAGLFSGEGPAGIIVRDIRLPRTLLAALIGATLGLSAPRCRACCAIRWRSRAVRRAAGGRRGRRARDRIRLRARHVVRGAGRGDSRARRSRSPGWSAIAGRRASLTVTLLAGLALASFAGAVTALILNLAPNPFIALEIAFWLLGSLEDRSADHLIIAAPFMLVRLDRARQPGARVPRAHGSAKTRPPSLGVDIARTRMMVVIGVALGVGAAVAVAGAVGFVGLVAPHLVRRAVGSDPARVLLPADARRQRAGARRRHFDPGSGPRRSRSSSAWSPR
jgi:iron complex transport system permease protein